MRQALLSPDNCTLIISPTDENEWIDEEETLGNYF